MPDYVVQVEFPIEAADEGQAALKIEETLQRRLTRDFSYEVTDTYASDEDDVHVLTGASG